MSSFNLNKLTKKELVAMASQKCQHGKTFLQHPKCWQALHQERVGFLDIEASNLKADFGLLLTWCIYDPTAKRIWSDQLKKSDFTDDLGREDKRITKSAIDCILSFDRIVTYFGAGYDIPFLRTRAIHNGLEFVPYGQVLHTDLYFVARNRLKLSSNRLENVCRNILGKTQKTRIENKYWLAGQRGNQDALAYILDHNEKDVIDLERAYRKLTPYFKESKRSL
jgi:uncharacterized protein YprB with RNaseH-like and TPR domain